MYAGSDFNYGSLFIMKVYRLSVRTGLFMSRLTRKLSISVFDMLTIKFDWNRPKNTEFFGNKPSRHFFNNIFKR